MYTMYTIPRLTHVLLGIDINRLVPVPAIYQYLSSKDVRYFFFFFFFSRSKQGGEIKMTLVSPRPHVYIHALEKRIGASLV